MSLVGGVLSFLGIRTQGSAKWEHVAKKDKNIAALLKEGFQFIVNARVATRPIRVGSSYGYVRVPNDTTSEFAIKKRSLENEFGHENVRVSLAYDINGNSFDSARGLWVRKCEEV